VTANYNAKLRSLRDGSLEPQDFSHLDHIGVAYEAIAHHDFFEALCIIADGLRDLACRANAPRKFNATVTFAFMSLIAERMKADDHENPAAFIRHNADLTTKSVLAPWYSDERLSSEFARSVPLLPDNLGSKG